MILLFNIIKINIMVKGKKTEVTVEEVMALLYDLKTNNLTYFTQDEAEKIDALHKTFKNDPSLLEDTQLGSEFMNIFTDHHLPSCRRSIGANFLLDFNFQFGCDGGPIDGLVDVILRRYEDRDERDSATRILLKVLSVGPSSYVRAAVEFKTAKLQQLSELLRVLDEI